MKLLKFKGKTSGKVDVKYTVELVHMARQAEPPRCVTISAVASLGQNHDTSDVLASALYGVDVPTGTYAVRLTVNGIEWLKFILVADDMAIELATPEFVVLQDKPYIVANYVDMHEIFDVHLCNMCTGVTSHVQGYVRIDEVTRSVALSRGITRSLNNGIYCARLYTRLGGYLTFFSVRESTVKYFHTPAFIRHKGY